MKKSSDSPPKGHNYRQDSGKFQNYMAIAAIFPAVFSVMTYEFVSYMANVVFHQNPDYNPIDGIGMLVPMALLMELFTFLFSRSVYKKMDLLIQGINKVGKGDFQVTLDANRAGPLREVAENFNRMTAELRSVQTLRTDFVNDFSHEFKTPITSINGFANLLLDTEVPETERREYLQIIAEESERLAALSRETLMMSQLDSRQSIPDREPYALDEQLKQNIILLSPEWEEKEIEISVNLEPATYVGNPSLMSHVWLNILNNAIKFTPQKGRIAVCLRKEDNKLAISFTDTGQGMSKETAERVFDKYYQGDSSHASKGLGLGLSIAYRIVELCQGKILISSKPGEGSTFTVLLPALTDRNQTNLNLPEGGSQWQPY